MLVAFDHSADTNQPRKQRRAPYASPTRPIDALHWEEVPTQIDPAMVEGITINLRAGMQSGFRPSWRLVANGKNPDLEKIANQIEEGFSFDRCPQTGWRIQKI